MPKRPERFDEIKGHPNLVEYFTSHLTQGTLPQFIILEGEEGLGKSSFAKLLAMGICCESEGAKPCYECSSCQEIKKRVIQENKETEMVKLFNMSINGGKDAAKEVVANLTLGISGIKKRVVILDEAHAMTEAAQDAFLVNTEYLVKGVHMILATTNTLNLAATLKSRAVTIRLNRLKQADLLSILRSEVISRYLTIQGGDATLNLIATWAEGKPRIALNLLGAFAPNSSVSASMVKEFIGFVDVDDVLPAIEYLGGSMTHGLAYVSEMKLSASMLDIMIEVLKIKKGQASYKLSRDEAVKVRKALVKVSEKALVKFIYGFAAMPKLSKAGMLAAFIKAHDSYDRLFESDPDVLNQEIAQKSATTPPELQQQRGAAPSMSSLLKSSAVIQGENK